MKRAFPRRTRHPGTVLAAVLVLTLSAGLTATPARAQNDQPPATGEEEKGRPLDGYLLTGCFVGAAMFIVAKTARRTVGR
jgi:hypothetical protein